MHTLLATVPDVPQWLIYLASTIVFVFALVGAYFLARYFYAHRHETKLHHAMAGRSAFAALLGTALFMLYFDISLPWSGWFAYLGLVFFCVAIGVACLSGIMYLAWLSSPSSNKHSGTS